MKQILCFGDSNTYGLIPGTKDRYDWDTRWSGRIGQRLWEDGCRIVEEGLCGRTTVFDDPLRDGRRGTELLSVILETHKPVDVVVLMLGTNDCKTMYDTSAEVIGRGVERLLDQIRSSTPDSKILLMSPIALGEGVGEAGYDPEFDESSVAVSKRLPEVYRRIAHERGISFLAASAYAKPSEEDREHMNEEGHAALAEAVYAKLKEMLTGEKENAQIPA
ncbi:MAG: GDSL-type esterase/lipase family protein [Roseburia hominis]